MNFDEQLKMIDICAVGVLRITSALVNANLLAVGSKVIHNLYIVNVAS